MTETKRGASDGRPPLHSEPMTMASFLLTKAQKDWLKQQGGSAAYLRGLIDAEIEKAKGEAKK